MALSSGTALGPYRITSRVGAGGMGEVYTATDTRLGRTVAIKVLPEQVAADEPVKRRFQREAKTISSLNHPNICALYDIGEQDGVSFLVMEYLAGETLGERLRRDGPLPLEDAVRYGREIAGALQAAHAQGIVHRDLKPGNVMLTSTGSKVLDFGIAAHTAEATSEEVTQSLSSMTAAGSVAGTVPYMSPEALRGEPPDARSDVWAFGVLLQEMMTGSRPFEGDTGAALTSAILRDPPAPMSDDSPEWLRVLVGRCLSREPAERYQGAEEILAALEGSTSPAPAVTLPAPSRRQAKVARLAVAAIATSAVVVGTFFAITRSGGGDTEMAPVVAADAIQSLAVLPLENVSGDPDQEYLSDGMTATLITELAKLGSIRVISRTSVMTYKNVARPLPEIARELGVDAIVEGSMVRSGDQVRITAQLVRASTEENLWADSYQRGLSDILALQNEMARMIGGQIQGVLTPEVEARLGTTGPVDPVAYELTLRGHFYVDQLSLESLERAVRYFEDAIEADPNYSPAHAGLALTYYSMSSTYFPPLEVMPKARAAAERAIELDPTLAEAHTWLGIVQLFFDHDWAAAGRSFETAIELNPSSAEARTGYSNYLLSVGRLEDAVAEVLVGESLMPGSVWAYASPQGSQWTAYMAGKYDLAIEKGREAVLLDPRNAWARVYLGTALQQAGEVPEGLAELEEASRLEDTPLLKAFLANGYAVGGQLDRARELLGELEEVSRQQYTCAYEIAVVHTTLGNVDEALSWLYKARADRADCIPYLNIDPRFDAIRDDPRFQALVDEIGFESAGSRPVARVEPKYRSERTVVWRIGEDSSLAVAQGSTIRGTVTDSTGAAALQNHPGPERRAMFDMFNVFNANATVFEEHSFGDVWLDPQVILPGRLGKFAFQMDF